MAPSDITGTWIHENAVPMGGGVMRIASSWHFSGDGGATLETKSVLEHESRIVNEDSTNHAGRWSIASDELVVELPGHSDSPLHLTLTELGELKSNKRGIWRRSTEL